MTDDTEVIAGRYRLLAKVGRGAMGVVWQARDQVLDRVVAVKQLDVSTDKASQRGMREARVAARLRHPHAITVYDVVEHRGSLYLVMEFQPSSLAGLLTEHGTLPAGYVAKVGAQVASALAAAHAEGIIHRDVTPGNVLITSGGSALIADFGISRASGEASVTGRGFIAGTPAYLAPEVAGGAEADFPSDVFSLGATLYTALEGKPPFGTGKSLLALLVRIAHDEVEPLTHTGPLAGVVLRMLRRDAAERPDMAEVQRALAAIAEVRTAPVPPPATATRVLPRRRFPRRRLVAAATVASGLAAAGLVGLSAGGGETTGAAPATPSHLAAPVPVPTTSASASAEPAADDSAGCDASYRVTQTWQGGYQVLVTVRNVEGTSLHGWVVRWMQPAGHQIGDLWNGTLQQYGESVAVANAQWNAVVKADGATDFGLIGTATGGSPAPPALTCQAL